MSNPSLRSRWLPVAVAAMATVLVAILGGLASDVGPWYRALNKPAFQPPDWLFGPVWFSIYLLSATAGVSAWRGASTRAERSRIVLLFSINAFLNVFWSFLFFRLQRPDLALIEVGFLWVSVLLLIVGLRPLSKRTTYYLLPYLVWVGFAAVLNGAIVRLNPGL